ncbi:GerA spore germination protein [Caldicellulosiruptor saccharolyticus DSM 8903]|uniref:GerA spore germination protein n=1 Tax=Caldicellulosiruptor saccharolyticus (strain ATCC 43494 / DSM 8903 / Tp8T 6331) TaxID=351627 RepID=A4XN57_CALS8|nr:spore germination protein [Caldicellulosiruptor saccharolyticus]ABP68342.1 GerA spore germination protein [Caldicellulosiruptor saccharolyticus DSM 8903]
MKKNNLSQTKSISTSYDQNLENVKSEFGNFSDLIIREFKIGPKKDIRAFLVMVDELVDKLVINEHILKPLMKDTYLYQNQQYTPQDLYKFIKDCILYSHCITEEFDYAKTIHSILCGDVALFVDGIDRALLVSVRGWESRGIEEPNTEVVVRGPREGFTENLRTNTALIRRKIRDPKLKIESMKIGRISKTDIAICYIESIAKKELVDEVKRRLEKIDMDYILESGYIEAFIEDGKYSIFSTVGNSEKPDVVVGKLMEGRVAILVDGTPFALTVPYLFVEAFQTSEDYYSRPYYYSIVRLLRYFSFFVSTTLPAIYIAITTFHQELLPTSLLISIASAQAGIPFPSSVETLTMLLIYEILKEAGVRLPRPVGQAISIVGALVIGDAAVSAGLIGAPMVVTVAFTAISTFMIPAISDACTIIRFACVIMASICGLYGIMLVWILMLIHLCHLKSFGVNFFAPIAPTVLHDLKDVFVRFPWSILKKRPIIFTKKF